MEIHDYNTRMAGREEGREEGISAIVSTLKELQIEKAVVIQKVIKQFNLLPHIAETKVEMYWNQ